MQELALIGTKGQYYQDSVAYLRFSTLLV